MCSGVRCHQVQLQWESSLRVKLQRAEKNLAAETKLEPCLNHTQNLPCHWTYSIVPTNNRLIFVLKKNQSILTDMPWLHLGLKPGVSGSGAWQYFHLLIFLLIRLLYIKQCIIFLQIKFFTICFLKWVSGWRSSLCWGLIWSSLLTLASASPSESLLFHLWGEEGEQDVSSLVLTFCEHPHIWWKPSSRVGTACLVRG